MEFLFIGKYYKSALEYVALKNWLNSTDLRWDTFVNMVVILRVIYI
jgi:hypothetical protein